MNDLLLSVKVRACHAAASSMSGLMKYHVSCPGSRMAGLHPDWHGLQD